MTGFKSKKLLAGRMDPLDLDDMQTLILENERLNKKVKQLGNDLKEMAYYYYLMVGEGDDNTEEARGLMFEYKFVDDDGFWIGDE